MGGPLYRFTSGNIPARLIINQTAQAVMTVLSDSAGVPTADREFDTDTELYNRQLSPGYLGVQEVQAMLGAFIYDTAGGKARLELPATRAAKSTSQRYTDGDPTAAEVGIPPPRRLTRPFGIINSVEGEYQYYTPAGQTGSSQTVTFPEYEQRARGSGNLQYHEFARTRTLGFTPSGSASVSNYSIDFEIRPHNASNLIHTVSNVGGGSRTEEFTYLGSDFTFEVRDLSVTLVGSTICMTGELSVWFTDSPSASIDVDVTHLADVTVSDVVSFEQTVTIFPRGKENAESIGRYGFRPRSAPLIIGIFQSTPLAGNFTPSYTALDAAIQLELDTYATAIPVFALSLASGTVAGGMIFWRGDCPTGSI